MTPTTSCPDFETAKRVHAMRTDGSNPMVSAHESLWKIMPWLAYSGSGGIIPPASDHKQTSFHIGSSPYVVELQATEGTSTARNADSPPDLRGFLQLSVVEQLQELQATLALNKSQLARILRVSRPALYEWFRGKEPNATNTARLHTLLRCLARARASSASPLNARFVRQSADLDKPALLEMLPEERLDEGRVVSAIEQARALEHEAARKRAVREEQLRELGFEDSGPEQRQEHIARNMALRNWAIR